MKKKIWKILGGVIGIAAVACVIPACVVSCGSSAPTTSQPVSQNTTNSTSDTNVKTASSNKTTVSSTKTDSTPTNPSTSNKVNNSSSSQTASQNSTSQSSNSSTPVNNSQPTSPVRSTSSTSNNNSNPTTTSSSSSTSSTPVNNPTPTTSSTTSSSPTPTSVNNAGNSGGTTQSNSSTSSQGSATSSNAPTPTPTPTPSSTSNPSSSSSSTSSPNGNTSTSSSSSTTSSSSSSKTQPVNQTPTPVTPTMTVDLGTNSLNLQNLISQLKISNIATFYNNWYDGQYVNDLIPYLTNNNPNITISDLITNIKASKAKDTWGDITGFTISNNSGDIINLKTANNLFITTITPGNSTTVNLPSNMLIALNLPTNAFANSSVTWVMGNLIHDKANTIAYGPARAFWSQSRYGGYGYLFSFFGIDNFHNYHYGFKYGEKNVYTMDSSKWYTYQWLLPDGFILMSWVAQILGWNESNQNALTAYKLYIPEAKQNGSVVINEVKFNNTWYDTDITIECGNGFLLW